VLTAPNSKWPVVVRWKKFLIFDMQLSRRLLIYGPSAVSCESLWAIKNMTESKFRLRAFLPPSVLVIFITAFIIIIYFDVPILEPNTPVFFNIIFSTIFIYIILMLLFGELKSKAIKVFIEKGTISKKGFLGYGPTTKFELNNISGYKTSILNSKGGSYEYLYLIEKNKKIIKLSEFYHRNYKELKIKLINNGVKNLGVEQWNFIRETIEIFS
jgi:hypothetical protein